MIHLNNIISMNMIQMVHMTQLIHIIHMYIKNDYPLVIRYDVANLGHIKLCLSPNIET